MSVNQVYFTPSGKIYYGNPSHRAIQETKDTPNYHLSPDEIYAAFELLAQINKAGLNTNNVLLYAPDKDAKALDAGEIIYNKAV